MGVSYSVNKGQARNQRDPRVDEGDFQASGDWGRRLPRSAEWDSFIVWPKN